MPIEAMHIEVIHGDITRLALDAIVNAANESLLGGGGVDGAIHRAAGPGLLAECSVLPEVTPGVRCPTGEARLTEGHELPARYVIHTVGPIWHGGGHGESALLASCYRESLRLLVDSRLASIAFPAISCGIYGYPPELAVQIAVGEARAWRVASAATPRVVFCCFDAAMAARYRDALGAD
jgi:O-acetyl-ADP-ribose deacetylase (regulator of RNase III)